MTPRMTRRQFLRVSAGAGAGAAAGLAATGAAAAPLMPAAPQAGVSPAPSAPEVLIPQRAKPLVIGSANAHKFRNGGPRTCVEEVFERIVRGDDVLSSIVAGVNILELDPEEDSVGYGGLPNGEGVVQLDASVMHGPKRRAGAVAALEGVRTPSNVAQVVMEHTDHHLLVGQDAQGFARRMGFRIEDDLNTERSRRLWLEWRRRIDPDHWLDPEKRSEAAERARERMVAEGLVMRESLYGTVHCSAMNAGGEICGATSTSGLAWKIPGRVGDSPILGAGLYVDGDVGAAGSTGRGEANLFGHCSFLIVERMRAGVHPKDAAMEALRRIRSNTIEKRLRNSRGEPNFQVSFYMMNRRGEHAGVALYPGSNYAICTEGGARLAPMEALLSGGPRD